MMSRCPDYSYLICDIISVQVVLKENHYEIISYHSYGHTFYAITDGSYILQTEEGAKICGEAYMIHDGKIEQVCSDGTERRLA